MVVLVSRTSQFLCRNVHNRRAVGCHDKGVVTHRMRSLHFLTTAPVRYSMIQRWFTRVHTFTDLMISMTEGKRLGREDVQRSRIYNAGRLMRYEICKLEPVQALCNNRPRWSSKRRFGKRGCEKHNTGRRWRSVRNDLFELDYGYWSSYRTNRRRTPHWLSSISSA